MKKRMFAGVIIVIIIAIILCIKPILKITSNIFWNIIAVQFDKEENDRQQKVEKGELIRGKDTVLIWGNMYEIGLFLSSKIVTLLSKIFLENSAFIPRSA